ncbi:MAG: hypothetical protein JWP52_442 [Rhizobacter sp.]|nr:hypothetical protein [Rhizobacter sp.]
MPTISAPMASPSHHTRTVRKKSDQAMTPLTNSHSVPFNALSSIDANAPMQTNSSRSRRRSSAAWKPSRCSATAAASGPKVLPAAISKAAQTGVPTLQATAKAPRLMPGHMRRPPRSKAATAMPVGGQIRVTKEAPFGSDRPIHAPMK